jgi:putative DNA primase/helicase
MIDETAPTVPPDWEAIGDESESDAAFAGRDEDPPALTDADRPGAPPMSPVSLSNASPAREIVAALEAAGHQLVMWSATGDQKGPNEKGWPEKTWTVADYKDGYRVGSKTGVEISPGRFLHDTDIDWGLGGAIAQQLLPATGFAFGRKNKPLSHNFYTTSEPLVSIKYVDPVDKSTLIELRGTKDDGGIGLQTMVPPSVWSKNGQREPLTFVARTGPAHLDDPARLTRAVRNAAMAMLFAKHFGPQGFGHDIRLPWAGFMLRAGVSVEECIAIGNGIISYTGNKDTSDIQLAINSTAKRLQANDKEVQGGPALAQQMRAHGKAIVACILEWLGKSPAPQLIIRKASDIPDERLEKIFGGRLARGSFSLISGPGEAGKGMFSTDLIAHITTGAAFPGESRPRPPASVLVCVTEDSTSRVKARLRAAGADLDRVYFVEGPEVKRGGLVMPSPMLLDEDAGGLVRHAKQVQASTIFLETVVEHFGDRSGKSHRSTNNEADVRAALAPFRAICALAGLYGFGAMHPRKSVEGTVDDSISGSAAFRNVARAAHHVYRDPEDESENPVRLLFTSKSNYLARRPPTLRFQIVGWDESLGVQCSCVPNECMHEGRVMWERDPIDARTAEEIWQAIAERSRERRDVTVQQAEEFLMSLVNKETGEIVMTPKDIFKLAGDDGLSKAAITRAKDRLKFISVKDGFPAAVVAWKLPARDGDTF